MGRGGERKEARNLAMERGKGKKDKKPERVLWEKNVRPPPNQDIPRVISVDGVGRQE